MYSFIYFYLICLYFLLHRMLYTATHSESTAIPAKCIYSFVMSLCTNFARVVLVGHTIVVPNKSYIISSHLISSHLISSHLISSHLISSHLISSHLISSHLISSHLISSHLISSHLISSHLISSHLISSHLISSHLISSHLISSHLISSHLISSHLISSHLISSHLISSYLILSYFISYRITLSGSIHRTHMATLGSPTTGTSFVTRFSWSSDSWISVGKARVP